MLVISASAQTVEGTVHSSSEKSIAAPCCGCRVTVASQIGETAGAFVDGDEDEDAAEPVLVVEVDGEVLAGGDGAGAVVSVEMDVRRLAESAEGVAERLDDSLAAVGQFVERAQVEIEVRVVGDGSAEFGCPSP